MVSINFPCILLTSLLCKLKVSSVKFLLEQPKWGLDIISWTEKKIFLGKKFYMQFISKNQINFDKGETKMLIQSIIWEQMCFIFR